VLARAALAVALARDDDLDTRAPDAVGLDRERVTRLEADVREAPERRVEMHHHRQRRDLVGRDVVAQRPRGVESRA
jgi:hypothetical protein